jgi:hypothetical protein
VVNSLLKKLQLSRSQSWLIPNCVVAVAAYLFLLCLIFEPRWETNDDIAMSMVAHGYGLAAVGSPNLIFSNVIWGYLVRVLPNVNDILSYSIATLASLLLAGTTTLYFLQRLGVEKWASIVIVFLILLRPTIFPQFTINAGLLTVAAFLGFWAYSRSGGLWLLFIASILAFLGYIIRSQEFLLVLAITLPLLPWDVLRKNRQLQIAFLGIFISIVSAVIFDLYSYSGNEWQHFHKINSARAPFTDFGAGDQIKNYPAILDHYHYSVNDIDLIKNFFFVDPKIADPQALRSMLAELGPLLFVNGSILSGFESIKALLSTNTLPIFLTATLLFILKPKWTMVFSWGIFLSTLFLMGLWGRGGILRVYIPLLTFLCIAPLVYLYTPSKDVSNGKRLNKTKVRQLIGVFITIAAFVFNYLAIAPQTTESKENIRNAQAGILGLPTEVLVSWGVGIRIESIFPVLANNPQARNLKIYPFGVFTHAPFSISYFEESNGRGFIQRLRSAEGVPIVAYSHNIDQLRTWCTEHFDGELRDVVIYSAPLTKVQRVWCIE